MSPSLFSVPLLRDFDDFRERELERLELLLSRFLERRDAFLGSSESERLSCELSLFRTRLDSLRSPRLRPELERFDRLSEPDEPEELERLLRDELRSDVIEHFPYRRLLESLLDSPLLLRRLRDDLLSSRGLCSSFEVSSELISLV